MVASAVTTSEYRGDKVEIGKADKKPVDAADNDQKQCDEVDRFHERSPWQYGLCGGFNKGIRPSVTGSSCRALWPLILLGEFPVDDLFGSFRRVFTCRRFGAIDGLLISLVYPCLVPMIEIAPFGATLFLPQGVCFCVSVRFIAHVFFPPEISL